MDIASALDRATQHLAQRPTKRDVRIVCVERGRYRSWLKAQAKTTQNWLKTSGFVPESGRSILVPDRTGSLAFVAFVFEPGEATPWTFASLAERLPAGRYAFDEALAERHRGDAALGWALASYRFARYKPAKRGSPTLAWPSGVDRSELTRQLAGTFLGRDLINTPTSDLGPEQLADAAVALAQHHEATATVLVGEELLRENYPAIHAVGRASASEPRLIDLRWGAPGAPRLRLVGKGVCFDSGGLDLKTAAGMKLMKKDMGGAASVLALAHMIMDAQLDVDLRVLIPAVENSVSADAYRPGDVLSTRKGLTVEVGNTDAEGRLILCDALADADADDPDLLIDMATLTGAARVALGTELPALFCTDPAFAASLLGKGEATSDPLWSMPLFDPYRRHLDSPIANLNNISSVPYGGAITAALFLREFVRSSTPWVHVDTMGWNSGSRPGRPSGGEVMGVRALFAALCERYGA